MFYIRIIEHNFYLSSGIFDRRNPGTTHKGGILDAMPYPESHHKKEKFICGNISPAPRLRSLFLSPAARLT